MRYRHVVALDAQSFGQHLRCVAVVVHHHHTLLERGRPRTERRRGHVLLRNRLSQHRQPHDELAAAIHPVAPRGDRPAVQRHQALHQGEPETEAAVSPVRSAAALDEEIEDARQQLRPNADAVVADAHDDLLALPLRGDDDVPRLPRVLRRIRQQIRKELREAHPIAVDAQPLTRQLDAQVMAAFLQQRADDLHRLLEGFRKLHRSPPQLELPTGNARHVEEVVDEPREVRHLSLDHFALAPWRPVAAELHQLHRGGDGRQRIA